MAQPPIAQPRNHFGVIVILVAIAQHLLWCGMLLANPDVCRNPAIAIVASAIHAGTYETALAFGLAALLSLYSLVRHLHGVKGFILVIPQQVIMLAGLISIVQSVVTRKMSVPIPADASYVFLASSQLPAIGLIVGHTVAVIGRYGRAARVA